MIETRPLLGVIPVVQTPLREDQSIDVDAIHRHFAFLNSTEVGGYWVLGTGGEDMNLTYAKRLEVARAATEANNGQKPLVLGAGFYCMEDIKNFMRETEGLEFDAYHVMPYHPLLSLGRLDWFYRELADHASKPLWLYTSANWARPITPQFVAGLLEHENITGIKFSTQKTADQMKVIEFASAGFQVITAVAKQFYAVLCMGSKASTTSLAGALPEVLIELYQLFLQGKHDDALTAQRRLNAFLGALPKTSQDDNFLAGAVEKYILQKRGICEPYMTSYYRELDEDERRLADKVLQDYQVIPGTR